MAQSTLLPTVELILFVEFFLFFFVCLFWKTAKARLVVSVLSLVKRVCDVFDFPFHLVQLSHVTEVGVLLSCSGVQSFATDQTGWKVTVRIKGHFWMISKWYGLFFFLPTPTQWPLTLHLWHTCLCRKTESRTFELSQAKKQNKNITHIIV